MNPKKKIGLMVAASFAALVGGVLTVKQFRGSLNSPSATEQPQPSSSPLVAEASAISDRSLAAESSTQASNPPPPLEPVPLPDPNQELPKPDSPPTVSPPTLPVMKPDAQPLPPLSVTRDDPSADDHFGAPSLPPPNRSPGEGKDAASGSGSPLPIDPPPALRGVTRSGEAPPKTPPFADLPPPGEIRPASHTPTSDPPVLDLNLPAKNKEKEKTKGPPVDDLAPLPPIGNTPPQPNPMSPPPLESPMQEPLPIPNGGPKPIIEVPPPPSPVKLPANERNVDRMPPTASGNGTSTLDLPAPAEVQLPKDKPSPPVVVETPKDSPSSPAPVEVPVPLPKPGDLVPPPTAKSNSTMEVPPPTVKLNPTIETTPPATTLPPATPPMTSAPGGSDLPSRPITAPANVESGPKPPQVPPVPVRPESGPTPPSDLPATLGSRPAPADPLEVRVDSYDEDWYYCKPGDTLESISQKFYYTPKYEQALRQYNLDRNYKLLFRQEKPNLPPGEVVKVPPARILERSYPTLIPGHRHRVLEPGTATNGNPATPPVSAMGSNLNGIGSPRIYTVRRDGMTLRDIAREELRDENQWTRIFNLNRQWNPSAPLPVGTSVYLPGSP